MRLALAIVLCFSLHLAAAESHYQVRSQVSEDYAYLEALYKHLHAHPELSSREEKTATRMAAELEKAGFTVTQDIGGHGVVGVLKNGDGPVVLLRTDLDALPITEQTGLPYASNVIVTNSAGAQVGVMHACGHDVHMTAQVGAARFLGRNTNLFRGTVVLIGQPAEEIGAGARAMLADGLFTRFPKPDYCLALHVDSSLQAGSIGYVEGYAMANVDSMNITVQGVGGHGAYPADAKDPIVLASQLILALQTIVSREISAIDSAVITVGSIHGGTKHNIIPDEVKLQLTLRSYTDEVRSKMIASIHRIARGLAEAAGLPEDKFPIVEIDENEFTPAMYNNPELTRRWVGTLREWIGTENLSEQKPVMGGEDFGMYGRTAEKIPTCMLWLGSVDPGIIGSAELPRIHSPFYKPAPEQTLKTGTIALVAAVLDFLQVE